MSVKWVIQNNLGSSEDIGRLVNSCDELSLPFELVKAIPFSEELPDIDTDQATMFYGSTNFVTNIFDSGRWQPGVFFDHDKFRFSTWREKYKEEVLNSNAEITTIREFAERPLKGLSNIFVRPNDDSKSFAGNIFEEREFKTWCEGLCSADDLSIKSETKIIVAEAVQLEFEWRLFVVDKKVSSGSKYRENFRITVSPDVPGEVIDFAEDLAKVWTPNDVFVMDICSSGGELYVIEVNCMNSSGFYANNVKKIVSDISAFVSTAVA